MENKELFIEYHEILQKYNIAKKEYDKLIEKKAMLVIKMQPGAINYSDDTSIGSSAKDKFTQFVEELEKLDPELQQARNEKDMQNYFLKKKEIELSNSNNILDKIYYLKYIKGMKIRHLVYKINYSKAQTYRKLEEIEKALK